MAMGFKHIPPLLFLMSIWPDQEIVWLVVWPSRISLKKLNLTPEAGNAKMESYHFGTSVHSNSLSEATYTCWGRFAL